MISIPRYELLLKELQKHTVTPSANLNAALIKVQDVAQHINESKRLVDRVSDLLTVNSRLAGSLPTDQMHVFRHGSLYAPHRRLIRSGELKKRGAASSSLSSDKLRSYFLFNDLLLWTNRDQKYKEHISLLHAEVSEPDETARAGVDVSVAFQVCANQLICDNSTGAHRLREIERLVLYTATSDEKHAWVSDLNIAIQEAADLQSSAGFLSVVPDRLRRLSEHVKPVSVSNSSPVPSSPPHHHQSPSLPPAHPHDHHHGHNHHNHNHQQFMLGPNAHFSSTAITSSPSPASSSTPPASSSSVSPPPLTSTSASPPPISSSTGSAVVMNGAQNSDSHSSAHVRQSASPRRPSAVLSDASGSNVTIPSNPTSPTDSPKSQPSKPRALSIGSSAHTSSIETVVAHMSAADLEKNWRLASLKMATLNRMEITALRSLKNPPAPLKSAMESIAALVDPSSSSSNGSITPRFGESPSAASADKNKKMHQVDDWAALQSLLVKPNFLALLSAFNVKCGPLNEKADKKISGLLKEPVMHLDQIMKSNQTVGIMWAWVCSYYAMKKGDSQATYVFIPPTPGTSKSSTTASTSSSTSSSSTTSSIPRPSSAGATKVPPPLPPRVRSKSPTPTSTRPASATTTTGRASLPASKPTSSPSALAAAAKAATSGSKSPAAKLATPQPLTPRRSSSAKKSDAATVSTGAAPATSPKASAASSPTHRRSSSAKKYGEKDVEDKPASTSITPTVKIGAKVAKPDAVKSVIPKPSPSKIGARPSSASSLTKSTTTSSTAKPTTDTTSPASSGSVTSRLPKPSIAKSASGGSLTARPSVTKPVTKSASITASTHTPAATTATSVSDTTVAASSVASAPASSSSSSSTAPPMSELTKCKQQYRNAHINYFHAATNTFYQSHVITHLMTPIVEPELSKLKADEEKLVAEEAEKKRKAVIPVKSKIDSGLGSTARPTSAKAASQPKSSPSATIATSSSSSVTAGKAAGAKLATSSSAVKTPRVPATAAAKPNLNASPAASKAKKDATAKSVAEKDASSTPAAVAAEPVAKPVAESSAAAASSN